jgi:hypothetical protein
LLSCLQQPSAWLAADASTSAVQGSRVSCSVSAQSETDRACAETPVAARKRERRGLARSRLRLHFGPGSGEGRAKRRRTRCCPQTHRWSRAGGAGLESPVAKRRVHSLLCVCGVGRSDHEHRSRACELEHAVPLPPCAIDRHGVEHSGLS